MKPPRPALPLLLLTATLLLAACGSKQDRIESGLKKGGEYLRQADLDKASVEVRNVLQIDPKSARAWLIAAQISEAQGEVQKAYGQFVKALELDPALLAAKVAQARLLMLGGAPERAEALVGEVLVAEPANVPGRTLRAALLARQGQAEQALGLARELAALPDAPPDSALLLAGLLSNQKKWSEALAVIEAALARDSRHPGLLQAAVDVAASDPGNSALAAKAVAFYQRAAELAPKNSALWQAWANHHLGRNQVNEAEAVLRKSVQALPDDSKRRLALLDFLAARRGPAAAEREYLQAIEQRPREAALRFGLARLYASTERPAEAQRVLREVVEQAGDKPDALTARSQLASFALAENRLDDARAQLAEVLKTNPRDGEALRLRGRLHLLNDAPRDAVTDLRAALRDQPGSLEVVQLLAQAHRAAGEPQLARETLAEAVKFRPADPALRAALAADMAGAKEFRAALDELEAGIKAAPQAPQLYEMKAQLALAQKDAGEAQRTLERLKSRRPDDATGYLRLGQLYTSQRRWDAALKEYDAAAVAVPGSVMPYIASVGLLSGLKRFDEAQARITARQQADPGNALVHHQLAAEVAINRGDAVAAAKAFQAAISAAPQASAGYLGLAKLRANLGDTDGAVAALLEGEKALPADRSLPMARAEYLGRARRFDDVIAVYEAMRTRFPADDAVVNNLAYLLAEVKGDKASVERALALAQRFAGSRNAGYLDSLGWIHYRLGQYDKAVPLLEKAVALNPAPLLQLHLGQALVKNGDRARGKPLIQRAIEQQPQLPRIDEARALLAQG